MWKNYFKIAIRNLSKNKLHTGINLIGLSLGLGVGVLIFFFVQFEMSFDDFHKDSGQIFRIERHQVEEGGYNTSFSTPIITAPTFQSEFSQVKYTTRMIGSSAQAYLDEETTQNQPFLMVGTDFLEIFSFPLLQGSKEKVLEDKFGVVITEEVAKKYFGDASPIGKAIRMRMGDDYQEYQVTGLLKDLPANSSIQFEMLMNDENMDFSIGEQNQNSWYNVYGDTYLKLNNAGEKASVEAGVERMMKKVLGEEYKEGEYLFTLQPIAEMQLTESTNYGMIEATRPTLLWILAGIAFHILLIACINFTTMAIGRSTTRAKEVGVRKTMGADFGQLVFQFLTEAFLTTVSALVLGLILAEVLLPTFNSLFEKELMLEYGPIQILILFGLVVLITAMAGAYPAFFMSSLRPIKVLKGNLSIRFGKQALRKGLVAFQFFISFLLIASTLIMVNQMEAIRSFDLGFDQEMVVIVDVPDVPSTSFVKSITAGFQQAELFRQALIGRSEVQSAGLTISTYGDYAFWDAGFPMEGGEQFNFRVNFVGGDYIKAMGLEIVKGRDFNPMPGADSSAFVINETFAKAMNWDDPLGEMMPNTKFKPHEIVGVVKDFHHNSLYNEIQPVVLAKSPETFFSGINTLMIGSATNPKVLVKGNGSDFESFKAMLENEWERVFPLEAFSFSFLDETVQKQYEADERLGKMVFLAACIAILIAAMGLFAMAALSIAGRTKEIGIRKVLGASSWSISWMFNKEFLLITVVGVLVALPLSLYFMQSWIAQFAVKAWPSWLNFGVLGVAGIVFTLLIVSAQSFRATQMNPVKTLKDE
ncbi:ABC-type transport system, involved in lipoprotein release, permease component [Algoriphagus locisalis]|uniref:ABC-type transport system, involved in lipoprotein release, permease component n=1 Tax=Algoriphagus locisalis TaxID=305507 RepID=A0A1I7E0N5_9BACT|nr:ABC transporter permease [Algoriphagus locisalis]SFU17465.1 ABC-type transport system, involved in lipoprotein release, permease component [Algoriphagus locisalis]